MENEVNTSVRYSWNKHDLTKIAKTFGYAMGSSAIGFAIMIIPQVDVPKEYAILAAVLIPAINTLLVAVKKWFAGKQEEVSQ